jgi:hypothetical protein
MMDWPMADAGSFDAITSTWLHIVLVVTPTSIMTYEDGTRVAEQQYVFNLPRPILVYTPEDLNWVLAPF